MGVGIVSKKVIASIPVGGGQAVHLKDASDVAGAGCEIHDQRPTARELLAMMHRPGGVDACPDCIAKATKRR